MTKTKFLIWGVLLLVISTCMSQDQAPLYPPNDVDQKPGTETKLSIGKEVSLLTDKSIQKRQQGYTSITEARKEQIQDLKMLVRSVEGTGQSEEHSKIAAITLLGELRADEAVDVLAENLLFLPQKRDPLATFMETQRYYTCTGALIKIGNPSIPYMFDKIYKSEKVEERNLAAWIIMQIDGSEIATFRIHQSIKEGTAPETRRRLLEALEYIKNFKPSTEPPKRTK